MDVPIFFWGYDSITRLTLVILGLTFTYFLWQIKEKSHATRLLIGSFACMTGVFLLLFLPCWETISEPLVVLFVTLSSGLLVQFAYHYPHHDQPRESMMALIVFGAIFLLVGGLGGYYNYVYVTTPEAALTLLKLNGVIFLCLPIVIAITLLILIRQAIHRASRPPHADEPLSRIRHLLSTLLHPKERDVQTLRNFAIAQSFSLLPGLAEPLYQHGLISLEIANYCVDLGLLLTIFILFITYLNHTFESVSLAVKLVSLSLVTLLIILGAIGLFTAKQFNRYSEHERQLQLLLVYDAIVKDDFSAIPPPVQYILAYQPSEADAGPPYRVVFSREETFPAALYRKEDQFRTEFPDMFIPDVPISSAAIFHETTGLKAQNFLRYAENSYIFSPRYLSYRFSLQEQQYEVDFLLAYHRQAIHQVASGLMLMIIVSSLFILLIFPRFFQKILITPLNNLLDGVKKLDAENPDIVIPVQYEDEIGFLTHAFNKMMASIKASEDALRRVNAELESRVEQRTGELSQVNAQLRRHIAERRHIETQIKATNQEMLAKNQQLQELNANKDKFFSVLSHDLQNPITRLLDLIRVIPENIEYLSKEELKETAETLHSSLENFYELLKNLFTWSGLQRGTMMYHPKMIDISHIIQRNINLLMPMAEEKHVRLRSAVMPGTFVHADPDMVYAVMRGLLSNALKYTFPGDKVDITVTRNEETMEIAISDTGVGISEENLTKLFRVDVSYQTPGTAGEEGTGLGLILCKELIEQHGGRIQAESKVGEGTTFRFTLPQMPQTMNDDQ